MSISRGDGSLKPVLIRLLEGRVGSTLVMQLLGTAPEIAFDRVYPFENSYLTYLNRLLGLIPGPRPDGSQMINFIYGDDARIGPLPFDPVGLDCRAFARTGLGEIWHAFSRSMAIEGEKPCRLYAEKFWGDVTPVIEAGLDPIVIDLVRDPRDVVASVRAFNDKSGLQSFGRAQARDDGEHLRHLVAGMSFRLKEFAAPLSVNQMLIRYEDLVTDLQGEVTRLENALGVTLDLDVVTASMPEMSVHMTSSSATDSVGRWLQDLSSDEVRTIERRLGEEMTQLGYALSTARAERTGVDARAQA